MKKLHIILLLIVLSAGCVDSLDNYNIDKKKSSSAPAPYLVSNAIKNLSDVLHSADVNLNNFRFYVQYWTSTTYLDEPRYNMINRPYSQNWWTPLYSTVLADLKDARRLINDDAGIPVAIKNNQLGCIGITEVLSWSLLVNTFGNVPYTEALNPEVSLPRYDDAKIIYTDLLTRLDASISLLNSSQGAFGSADVLYQGDVSKWIKFGNALKLRLAMTLADVDPAKAKTLVEQAAPNVITSNADNARIIYLSAPPNNNPASNSINKPLFTTREDYISANTIVDKMNSLNDPRRQSYFTTVNGNYIGGKYGFTNSYATNSKPGAKIVSPSLEGLILDYSEVEFLLAEAAARGFSLSGSASGDAKSHYNKAIQASILYWGGTQADVDTYLSQPSVDYATANGSFKEKIGVQKWLALYNRGYDAWNEWKRLDYPALLPPSGPGVPSLNIPVRMVYPINEQTLNGANRDSAAAAIGGDLVTTKLFWDVN